MADFLVILGEVEGLYTQFGAGLRVARDASGLTQQQVADRVGLTRTSVTNIEQGRQQISLLQLYRLAAAVGRQPAELLPDHDGGVDEVLSKHALRALKNDEEGLVFAKRVLRNTEPRGFRGAAGE